jgi:peptidyl-prolyl cis-trans isomerase A (cyclophilin A)
MTVGSIVTTALSLAALSVAPAASAQTAANPNIDKLKNPAQLTEKAPDVFRALFDTSKGAFTVEVHRDWAPLGADHFYNMVKNGFFDDVRFFRVVRVPNDFMVQFGINGNPAVQAGWRDATIKDDPVKQSNKKGYITFATRGPNTRTTQVFINYDDNEFLDSQGFAPFGRVVDGMNIVQKLYSDYGDGPPGGKGPDQNRVQMEGNAYLAKDFPKLDYIKTATIVAK